MKTFLPTIVIGLAVLTRFASAAPIDSYDADTLSTGSLSTWTNLTPGGQNATTIDPNNDPTVADTNAAFDGHNYVNFSANSGLLTSSALFSGSGDRTVVAVYDTPVGKNGEVNPIAGESGPGTTGTWFVLQARTSPPGNPYLAGFIDDASGGTVPVANQLTFAVATYSNTGSLESVYWAYGLSPQTPGVATHSATLNTVANPFTIGYDQGGEYSQGNMQIGLVQVYDTALSSGQADTVIANLQHYYSVPYEVPEPSTWAMMLGGLAFLGFLIRRKGDKFRA